MTDFRRKIGQLLIMGFTGCEVEPHSQIATSLQEDALGGVLLFNYDLATKCYGRNLKNRHQIKQLTIQLNELARSTYDNDGLPLFIALDYEGGAVDRLSKIDGCRKTLSARDQAMLSDEALYIEAQRMAEILGELGFNLNFAPIVDLNLNEEHGIIGKLDRSFSSDHAVVIRAAKQFVRAFSDHGIVCAYKHFPGHGSASGDTHQGFVDVTDSYMPEELTPYKSLLKDTRSPIMVMTAHVINRQLDPSGLPATLSYAILTALLRQDIGFEGVIVSDDLQMQAISHHYSLEESLSLTLNAGADMLIFANQLGHITAKEVIDCIEQLVASGAVAASRIEQSYQRVSRLKQATVQLA